IDLSHLDEAEREPAAHEQALSVAREPFNLSQAPLLRALLLRLDEHEHVLVLSFHHIVVDGWSAGVLTRELGEVYAATVRGEQAQLPELPIQYTDYAYWQRDWLSGWWRSCGWCAIRAATRCSRSYS